MTTPRPSAAQLRLLRLIRDKGGSLTGADKLVLATCDGRARSTATWRACYGQGWLRDEPDADPLSAVTVLTDDGRMAAMAAENAAAGMPERSAFWSREETYRHTEGLLVEAAKAHTELLGRVLRLEEAARSASNLLALIEPSMRDGDWRCTVEDVHATWHLLQDALAAAEEAGV